MTLSDFLFQVSMNNSIFIIYFFYKESSVVLSEFCEIFPEKNKGFGVMGAKLVIF